VAAWDPGLTVVGVGENVGEQKKRRAPWQSYFWSALICGVWIGGYAFITWVWHDGHEPPSRSVLARRRAGNVLSSLQANDFARVTAQFDSTMNEAFPREKLERDWVQLTTRFGAMQSWEPVEHLHHQGREIGTYLLQLEHGQVRATVTFDSNSQRLTGLCFEPPP